MTPKKILVPLDGSSLAEAALWKAVDLGGADGAAYSLLRAAEAHTLPGADPVEAQVSAVRGAEEYLERAGGRHRGGREGAEGRHDRDVPARAELFFFHDPRHPRKIPSSGHDDAHP